jgi:hypothetical protein
MAKLNDLQSIILSAGSQRESGSLLPLPEQYAGGGARVTKALTMLVTLAFAEDRKTSDTACIHRMDGDIGYGLFITASGLAAIGVSDEGETGEPVHADVTPAPRTSKIAAVTALLGRAEGASLDELVAATGWLPHTIRAALTGLRKKGQSIERSLVGGRSHYRIAGVA